MLDERGFKRPKYSELVADAENQARAAWGDKINTSPLSPLGIIIRIFCFFLNLLWQDAEGIYNSGFRDTATGVSLYRLGALTGSTLNEAQYARGELEVVGTPAYEIPAGTIARTESGVLFYTAEDALLDGNGLAIVPIIAQDPGLTGNVAAGAITELLNTDANITTISNPIETNGGREKETDPEFRSKMGRSVAKGGGGTSDSVLGVVLDVPGVRAATVINNRTNLPDAEGRPPKSYQVYILGGDEQEIAEAIFSRAPAGVEYHGDIEKTVADLSGDLQPVFFSRAEQLQVSISVNVTRNSSYPADGDDQIRAALVRYVGGEYGGGYYNGLTMGADVIYTRLISAVYAIAGVEDVAIQVGPIGSLVAANVSVAPYQVAQTSEELIEVTSHV